MPFRDVVGHRRLVRVFARSILRDSLPPSLILAGPSGVGKRLVAVATAQALNCASRTPFDDAGSAEGAGGPGGPGGIDACGVCASCRRIGRGVHPDVLIVEPGDSGSIKVDDVRDLIDRAAYRPFEGRRRVVIIDTADALVPAAQNALLKTLEEPPASSVFLLITARPDALLPTVRSRCPLLRFWPLGADDVAAVLVKLGRTESEARALAAAADGGMGRVLEADAGSLPELRDAALRVLTYVARNEQPRDRLEAAKELLGRSASGGASERAQLTAGLRTMASILRDIEIVGTGATAVALANPDARAAIEPLAVYRGERGVRAFEAVDQALAALGPDRNANAKIVADWLVLRL